MIMTRTEEPCRQKPPGAWDWPTTVIATLVATRSHKSASPNPQNKDRARIWKKLKLAEGDVASFSRTRWCLPSRVLAGGLHRDHGRWENALL